MAFGRLYTNWSNGMHIPMYSQPVVYSRRDTTVPTGRLYIKPVDQYVYSRPVDAGTSCRFDQLAHRPVAAPPYFLLS